MLLRFAYVEILYITIPLVLLALLYRFWWYRYPVYRYPLASFLQKHRFAKKSYHKEFLLVLRFIGLLLLAFMVARPQWVDRRSLVDVEGVDIVIALDVSGSMQLFDDLKDRRSRIDVAKKEAMRFIEKRTNDPIGIVLFGKHALSRTPITLDKHFLKEVVGQLDLGIIDPNGTWLGTGLATAVNRLKNSKAKSKIIILLTDGEPTPPEKVSPSTAIGLAKEFGIRVYTVGIGNKDGGYFTHPFMGTQRAGVSLNEPLLRKISDETGGKFFRASKPKEMRAAYNAIDKLEKTKYQTNLFNNYYEAFLTFVWIIMMVIGIEMLLRLLLWRGV